MKCTVFVPDGNNPEKNAAMRGYGAVVEGAAGFRRSPRALRGARAAHGRALRAFGGRAIAHRRRWHVRAGNLRGSTGGGSDLVPMGGGSGACGLITVRNALGSKAKIIGVGAVNADAVYRSWKGPNRVVGDSANTFAEGIATRVSFDLPFGIYKRYLDDFVQLTEDELAAGVRLALTTTQNLAEGAGAAAIAAAPSCATDWRGSASCA